MGASSIGNLASMASELRESVAGFTLPEAGVSASATGAHQPLMDEDLPLMTDSIADEGDGDIDEQSVATLDDTVDIEDDYDEDIHFNVEEDGDEYLDTDTGKK